MGIGSLGKIAIHKSLVVAIILVAMTTLSIYYVVLYTTADILTLIDRVVVDDTFYYLGVGRNIVAGNGITFDGVNPTNGVEPLWQLAILPIFLLTRDAVHQVQLTVAFSGALHISTGILIFFLAKRILASAWALLAAYFWLLNPTILKIGLMGMENSLSALVFSILCYLLIKWHDKFAEGAFRYPFMLGLVTGLLALARVESIFLAALVGLYLLGKARAAHWGIYTNR